MPRAIRLLAPLSLATLLALAPGCGSGKSTVSGIVKYKGQAVMAAQVDFVPEQGGPTATAVTDGEGRYSAEVPRGKCKVTVIPLPERGRGDGKGKSPKDRKAAAPPAPGPNAAAAKSILPAKYASPTSTPLAVEVLGQGTPFDITLED